MGRSKSGSQSLVCILDFFLNIVLTLGGLNAQRLPAKLLIDEVNFAFPDTLADAVHVIDQPMMALRALWLPASSMATTSIL